MERAARETVTGPPSEQLVRLIRAPLAVSLRPLPSHPPDPLVATFTPVLTEQRQPHHYELASSFFRSSELLRRAQMADSNGHSSRLAKLRLRYASAPTSTTPDTINGQAEPPHLNGTSSYVSLTPRPLPKRRPDHPAGKAFEVKIICAGVARHTPHADLPALALVNSTAYEAALEALYGAVIVRCSISCAARFWLRSSQISKISEDRLSKYTSRPHAVARVNSIELNLGSSALAAIEVGDGGPKGTFRLLD